MLKWNHSQISVSFIKNMIFPTDLLMEISSILMQSFFPVCDNNHWHIHVINILAAQVEILSSMHLQRGNDISVVIRRLSEAIDKAFHAHGMHRQLEVSKFVHVQPQIMQQRNGWNTSIVIIFAS